MHFQRQLKRVFKQPSQREKVLMQSNMATKISSTLIHF